MIGRRGWEAVGVPESVRRRVVVAGQVIDDATRAGLAAALVEICALAEPGRRQQTMSRADGTFAFTGLPEGKYRLRVYVPHSTTPYGEFTGEYQVTLQDPPLPPQWIEAPLPPRAVAVGEPADVPPVKKPMVRLTRARRGARNTRDNPS
jgi:Carboxypeptidase regulatory-like domain